MVLDRRKKESQLLRRLAAAVEAAVHRSGANQEEPGSEAKPRREPRAARLKGDRERRKFDGAPHARSH